MKIDDAMQYALDTESTLNPDATATEAEDALVTLAAEVVRLRALVAKCRPYVIGATQLYKIESAREEARVLLEQMPREEQ